MFDRLGHRSFIGIALTVLVEELGIPMPIPTDLLIFLAGVAGARSMTQLTTAFVLISIAAVIGSSGLYAVVRWGGRPFVDRFGPYLHLGPKQIARAEALLERGGWWALAIGRATPGIRYGTVIVAGLLNVSYWRFVTAHLVGSSLYIIVYLALGSYFGPMIEPYLHVPNLLLRLLWLAALAIGLPALIGWVWHRTHPEPPVHPSGRRIFVSALVAGFAGTTALAATWAMLASLIELFGFADPFSITSRLAAWLLVRGVKSANASIIIYTGLLFLCIAFSEAYYALVDLRTRFHRVSLPRQVVGLLLLTSGLVGSVWLVVTIIIPPRIPLTRFMNPEGPAVIAIMFLGILSYAVTTVYVRALLIALLPPLASVRKETAPNGNLADETQSTIEQRRVPAETADAKAKER